MQEDPDYILELGGQPNRPSQSQTETTETEISASKAGKRPFISVHFQCCNVYQRIYRNRAATAYVGHCPKCMRKVQVKIGPGGSNTRFFSAT